MLVVANIRANRKNTHSSPWVANVHWAHRHYNEVYNLVIESSSAIKDRMQDHGVGDNGMMRIRRIMSWAL